MLKKFRGFVRELKEEPELSFVMAQEVLILITIAFAPIVVFIKVSSLLGLPLVVDIFASWWLAKKVQGGIDRRLKQADEIIKFRDQLEDA